MEIKANEALNVVSQELDELYAQTWDDQEKIGLLQEEVRILREEKEFLQIDHDDHLDEIHFLNNRIAHINKNYSWTIMQMYLGYIAAFVNIGWTAWCLSSN